MSSTAYNIIMVVAAITSVFPLLLWLKYRLTPRNSHRGGTHKIIIEGNSGVKIELDLNKQNDPKKLLQTMDLLLGK